jgi:hypothetical protein
MVESKQPMKRKKGAAKPTARSEQSADFVQDLAARGEAASPAPDGSLPPGATHEVVGKRPDGTPVVRRKRFSTF